MNVQVRPHALTAERHLPFECVALVLQGGGALGAYQAGVYEALSEAGIHPDWIAGISIGAINAAITPAIRRIPAPIGCASFGHR
jgi:NTE family protein